MEETQIEAVELSPRDLGTLAEYFKNGYNATRAWMSTHPMSGYEAARRSGSEWLTKPDIKAAVEAHLAEKHMSVEEATERLTDIARGDIAQLMDVSSVGFNLDMKKAKEAGLTRLIKKVRQKTTTYIAKKESDEDREVTELEIELYSAHDALRDILKVKGGQFSRRENAPALPPGTVAASPAALVDLLEQLDRSRMASIDRSRAQDAEMNDTRNE